jgi:tartronate-semialdehyde synthase
VREPLVRVFQQTFHVMRSGCLGPVLIDLPFDVQMGEIFDVDTLAPLQPYKRRPPAQIRQAACLIRPRASADRGRRRVYNAAAEALLQQFAGSLACQ